jgi:hypothetical protein
VSEQEIQQRIRLACAGPDSGVRLWRNNVGKVVGRDGRLVTFGLCPGSADLVGYRSVTVTPDMVGQTVAVFTAIEVKTPTGRPTPAQLAWLEHVRQAGGRAGIARCIDDAERIAAGLD